MEVDTKKDKKEQSGDTNDDVEKQKPSSTTKSTDKPHKQRPISSLSGLNKYIIKKLVTLRTPCKYYCNNLVTCFHARRCFNSTLAHSSLDCPRSSALCLAHSARLGSPSRPDRHRLFERSKMCHQLQNTCLFNCQWFLSTHCHLS